MYAFSGQIGIPAGVTLAGYAGRKDIPTIAPGTLDVHGIGGGDWEICAVDALYPGVLARETGRVVAASHTHFAPQLDAAKPGLGNFSGEIAQAFGDAMRNAPREKTEPDSCTIFAAAVDIPVYRRFDYPASPLNAQLTRYLGFFPNDAFPVDRRVYIFVFSCAGKPLFSILYHACHPVTRMNGAAASPDYAGALRAAVEARFGTRHCLFFQGCAGDVRPNLAEKRTRLLPKSRINWRFKGMLSEDDEKTIDAQYREAVERAEPIANFEIAQSDFRLRERKISVRGLGEISIMQFDVGREIRFAFLPFEVSHRYHLEAMDMPGPRRFIVSCADDVRGYLPHAGQLRFGGYEVERSRQFTGLGQAISIDSRDLWRTE